MSEHKNTKPQKAKQKKSVYHAGLQKHIDHQHSKTEQQDERVAVEPLARKLGCPDSSYFYAYSGRKPQLLVYLERYLNKELQSLNTHEPKFQELKLQIYQDVFARFIKEFKTYQPLLSDIKREYETTLAYQQNQIHELEPLQSHLRLVTEECELKIRARWTQEHSEMAAIKIDKEKLRRELEALKEKEKANDAVVEHLQSELSQQYVLYREERDARKLLIRQLNDLTGRSAIEEHTTEENIGRSGSISIPKEQEDSNVVPQCNPATLEKTLRQTALQTLRSDFNQLKSDYDTLLALHRNTSGKNNDHDVNVIQTERKVHQTVKTAHSPFKHLTQPDRGGMVAFKS